MPMIWRVGKRQGTYGKQGSPVGCRVHGQGLGYPEELPDTANRVIRRVDTIYYEKNIDNHMYI